jgi:hypothetical protein
MAPWYMPYFLAEVLHSKRKTRWLRLLPVHFPWCLYPEVESEAVSNTPHVHGAHSYVLSQKTLLLSTWDWDFPRKHSLLTFILGQLDSDILLLLLFGSFWIASEDNHFYFLGLWYFYTTRELQEAKSMVFSSCSFVTLSRFCFTEGYELISVSWVIFWTQVSLLVCLLGPWAPLCLHIPEHIPSLGCAWTSERQQDCNFIGSGYHGLKKWSIFSLPTQESGGC